MGQSVQELKVKGLWNAPNPLSEVPKGGLEEAFEIVIDEPSLADSRRGQNFFTITSPLSNVDRFYGYFESIVAHEGSNLLLHEGVDTLDPFTSLSTNFNNPDDGFITHGIEANKNLYMTEALGIKKLDVDLASIVPAGAPPGLDLTGDLDGSTGYLGDDKIVAYRMLWGYEDASGNLILGAPTTRFVISNETGGTRNVELSFSIPDQVTTSWFYQIYRTTQFDVAVQPNDEMYLVLEGNPDSGEITAGVMDVTDETPDSLLGATLYTSPSQEGAENANYPPPFAKDITYFQNMTFFANTKSSQKINFNLIGVSEPDEAATAVLNITADITFTSVAVGSARNTTTFETKVNVAAPNPTNTVLVAFTGTAAAIVCTITPNDGTNNGAVPVPLTTAELTELVNTGLVAGKVITLTDASSLRILQTATGGGATDFADGGEGDNIVATFSGGTTNNNFQIGDTVTFTVGVTDIVFTGAATEDASIDEFEVFSAGTVAENIADTALSLCRVINQSPNNTYFYAYYISGFDDLPGQIFVESRPGVLDLFSVDSDDPDSFSPTFPIDSSQDVNPNRVYVSKPLQPESVPLYSYLDVGSANAQILRILALRDYVFVCKEDGIFTINGTNFSSLQQQLLDNSTKLIAPESLVVFNNQLLGFVDQGVAAISAAGVEIISRPIEKTLLRISQLPNFRAVTFGVAYESDRKYMLWTVEEDDEEFASIAYIYNQASNTWTNWVMDRTAGFVNPEDNHLYMFNPSNKAFYRERKTFTNFDYMDESYEFDAISENTSLTNYTLLVADAEVTNIEVGDVIFQYDLYSYVSAMEQDDMTGEWTITLTINIEFDVTSPLNVGKGFVPRLKYLPIDMESPGMVKQNQEFTIFFKDANFDSIEIGFSTDFFPDENLYDLIPPVGLVSGDWGNFIWGEINWGGVGIGLGQFPIRSNFPRDYSKSHWIQPSLQLSQPLTNLSFTGMNIVARAISTKFPGARMAA